MRRKNNHEKIGEVLGEEDGVRKKNGEKIEITIIVNTEHTKYQYYLWKTIHTAGDINKLIEIKIV